MFEEPYRIPRDPASRSSGPKGLDLHPDAETVKNEAWSQRTEIPIRTTEKTKILRLRVVGRRQPQTYVPTQVDDWAEGEGVVGVDTNGSVVTSSSKDFGLRLWAERKENILPRT